MGLSPSQEMKDGEKEGPCVPPRRSARKLEACSIPPASRRPIQVESEHCPSSAYGHNDSVRLDS